MPERRVTLTDFSSGMVSRRLANRIDTALRAHAVEDLDGFVVHPDGGLVRRRGTMFGRSGLGLNSPDDGTPAFTLYDKLVSGESVPFLSFPGYDGSNYELHNVNLQNNNDTKIQSNTLLPDLYAQPIRSTGKYAEKRTYSSAALSLHSKSATLVEETENYNPTIYDNVYDLPDDYYYGGVLETGAASEVREIGGTKYLFTNESISEEFTKSFNGSKDQAFQIYYWAISTKGWEANKKYKIRGIYNGKQIYGIKVRYIWYDKDDYWFWQNEYNQQAWLIYLYDKDGNVIKEISNSNYNALQYTGNVTLFYYVSADSDLTNNDLVVDSSFTTEHGAGYVDDLNFHYQKGAVFNYKDPNDNTKVEHLNVSSGVPFPTDYTTTYQLPSDLGKDYHLQSGSPYELDDDGEHLHTDDASAELVYTDLEDLYGYSYAYDVPTDMEQAMGLDSGSDYLLQGVGTTDYIFTNDSNATLMYHSDASLAEHQFIQIWSKDGSIRVNLSQNTLAEEAEKHISTIFQSRRIALDRDNGILFMSAPFAYNDFESEGLIQYYPAFYKVENPKWIASRGSVYIGTDKGEYEVLSNFAYFSNELGGVVVQRISNIGTDFAVYFGQTMVMVKDRRLIQIGYQGADVYQTNSIAEFIDNGQVITADTLEFGSHRYFAFVDDNDDLYVLAQSQSTGVNAWSKIDSNVKWIKAHNQDLYIAKERSGSIYLEVLPFDNLTYPGNRSDNITKHFWNNKVYGDQGGYAYVKDTITQDTLPASSTVKAYKVDESGYEYIGDLTTDASGVITETASEILTTAGESTEAYLYCYKESFTSQVKTLPVGLAAGISNVKNVNKVILSVIDSMAAKVRVGTGTWEEWSSEELYTGVVELSVESTNDDDPQIEIQSVDDKPLHIVTIEAEVNVGEY